MGRTAEVGLRPSLARPGPLLGVTDGKTRRPTAWSLQGQAEKGGQTPAAVSQASGPLAVCPKTLHAVAGLGMKPNVM